MSACKFSRPSAGLDTNQFIAMSESGPVTTLTPPTPGQLPHVTRHNPWERFLVVNPNGGEHLGGSCG
ncbi:hypothetical protein TREES_T100017722 [Tupaia chinensis]|uniref:Uncharacterized protein n=1 Tax=Tupaia chinensis TaxID=246437 RepID=L9KXE4_TUPCH|nr:hypothetical protein TREES_T100017722 [Tupaia chinensis]